MGAINGKPVWEESIYRLQWTDPIEGGPDGVTNTQPIQITNRTEYLKKVYTAEHSEDGTHRLTDLSIADNAGLSETKLQLDYTTSEIDREIKNAEDKLAEVKAAFEAAYGDDGKYLLGLLKETQLNWQYSNFGFAFELWHDSMCMRTLADVDVLEAVRRDDSIDIATNDYTITEETGGTSTPQDITQLSKAKTTLKSTVRVGQRLILWEPDGDAVDEVTIMSVLEFGRLRTTLDITHNYHNAKLGHTNWDVRQGIAYATPNGIYISKLLSACENSPAGGFVIRRDTSSNPLTLYYQLEGANVWTPCEVVRRHFTLDGWRDDIYNLPSGRLYIKVVGGKTEAVVVKAMGCFPSVSSNAAKTILTPSIVGINSGERIYKNMLKIKSSRYSSIYRDPYRQTEYRIQDYKGNICAYIVRNDTSYDGFIDFPELYNGTVSETEMPVPANYTIQCRHLSDMSELYDNEMSIPGALAYGYSDWSDPVRITLLGNLQYFGFAGYSPKEFASPFFSVDTVLPSATLQVIKSINEDAVPFTFEGNEEGAGFNTGSFMYKEI